MIDALHPVRVPTNEEEALRDVVRAREAVRGDLMRARQRLSKLLLRHDVRYEDTASAWTVAHRAWLTGVDLGERGAQITLLEYLGAIDAIVIRRDALEKTTASWCPARRGSRPSPGCGACAGSTRSPQSGCAPRSASSRASRSPGSSASYLGLTPSEDTSGEKRRQGAITKTGSRHARRLLVERSLALPPPAGEGTDAQAPPGQPARSHHRDLLASATPPAPCLATTRHSTRQAPHDRRGRRRPRAHRILLGTRERRRTTDAPRRLKRRQEPLATTRESIRDLSMSSPPRGPRSILDSRALTTKTGPAETVANPCTRV